MVSQVATAISLVTVCSFGQIACTDVDAADGLWLSGSHPKTHTVGAHTDVRRFGHRVYDSSGDTAGGAQGLAIASSGAPHFQWTNNSTLARLLLARKGGDADVWRQRAPAARSGLLVA